MNIGNRITKQPAMTLKKLKRDSRCNHDKESLNVMMHLLVKENWATNVAYITQDLMQEVTAEDMSDLESGEEDGRMVLDSLKHIEKRSQL